MIVDREAFEVADAIADIHCHKSFFSNVKTLVAKIRLRSAVYGAIMEERVKHTEAYVISKEEMANLRKDIVAQRKTIADIRERTIRQCADVAWLHIPDTNRSDFVHSALLELLKPHVDK